MKVYISADIEGVTGVTHWDETERSKPDYGLAQEQMTAEVAAACEGAKEAGATEIWVKDAHDTGRNLIPGKLPPEVKLVRGWSGHPFSMVQELDETFAALVMIGYHARAGSAASPLAHTMSGGVAYIRINDLYASEFLLHGYAAALRGVAVAFVSGDAGLCEEVRGVNPRIPTLAVKWGVGQSTVSIHPKRAVQEIQDGVRRALEGALDQCRLPLPPRFVVEIGYKDHTKAYRAGFYPGARLQGSHRVEFETDDYLEVLRFLLFVV
ncbi:MAG: M55 family metallopeptidase [Candidatus Acetothermia bacterium]|jgi:D-amino peptidase|nr:M55 family metallopeptidase [Candidatus Acetothermia bacterium]